MTSSTTAPGTGPAATPLNGLEFPFTEPLGGRLTPWKEEAQSILGQLTLAVVRFLALVVFFGMHWILAHWVIPTLIPEEWKKVKTLLEVLFVLVFVPLYVDQLFEMLAVFIPRLRGLRQQITGAQNNAGGGNAA